MFDSKGRLCSPKCKLTFFKNKFKDHLFLIEKEISEGKTISQIIYDQIYDINEPPKCKYCDLKTEYKSFSNGYFVTCGNKLCLKKSYGENPHIPTEIERKEISERMKSHNPMFNPKTVKRVHNTQRENNHGNLPMHSKESKKKALESRYELYNTFSPKSRLFRPKEYLMPSGIIASIQGYEYMALDILLQKHEESDVVICGKNHSFKYKLSGNEKTYYPDIFIPNKNLYIEVKCDYTYNCSLEKNLAKRDAVLEAGFNFEFWILNKEKELNII